MKTKNLFFVIAILFCIFLQKSFAQQSKLMLINEKPKAVSENQVKEKSDTLDLNLKVLDSVYKEYQLEVDSFLKNPNLKELKVGFVRREKGKWISLIKLNIKEIYKGKLVRQDGEIKFINKKIISEKPETNLFYIFNFISILLLAVSLFFIKRLKFLLGLFTLVPLIFVLGFTAKISASLATTYFAIIFFVACVTYCIGIATFIGTIMDSSKNYIKLSKIFLIISLILNVLAAILMYF